MKKIAISLTTLTIIFAAIAHAQQPSPTPLAKTLKLPSTVIPLERKDASGVKQWEAILQSVKDTPDTQLVFIGDSITLHWKDRGLAAWNQYFGQYKPLDFGIGYNRTEHILWRIDHGNFDGIHPKLIVLLIGTNNTNSPATATAEGIKAILDRLQTKQPQAKVLLLAIFPRGATPADPLRVRNEQVNAIIKNFADNQRVFFLDIGKDFLQPDGTLSKSIFPDLLHPNSKGYEIWARAILPEVQKLTAN